MSSMKKTAKRLVALMLMAGMAPLAGLAQAADEKPAAPAPAEQPAKDTSKVIMKVNGKDVTENQLNQFMDMMLQRSQGMNGAMFGQNESSTQTEQLKQTLRPEAKKQVAKQTVFMQEIEKNKDKVDAKAVDAEMAKLEKKLEENGKTLKELEAQGYTAEKIKGDMRMQLAAIKVIEQYAGATEPTDEQIKGEYEKNKEQYDAVRASHILIGFEGINPRDPEAKPDPKQKEAAKKKAEEVLKKAKAGEDFAKLAQEYSTCPSKQQGGDLNFFGKGQMVPEFDEATRKIKTGEISDIVETQFGYHIIKRTGERSGLEANKAMIQERLLNQNLSEKAPQAMDKLMDQAKVEDLESTASATAAPKPEEAKKEEKK